MRPVAIAEGLGVEGSADVVYAILFGVHIAPARAEAAVRPVVHLAVDLLAVDEQRDEVFGDTAAEFKRDRLADLWVQLRAADADEREVALEEVKVVLGAGEEGLEFLLLLGVLVLVQHLLNLGGV